MFVSPKDQGSRKEGYVDPRYADLKKRESKKTKESASGDEPPPKIDLSAFYKKPERISGWRGGVYSPPNLKQQQAAEVTIKEF